MDISLYKGSIPTGVDASILADRIASVSEEEARKIASELGIDYLTALVHNLSTDTSATFLRNIPADIRDRIIGNLPQSMARDLNELFSYKPNTVGSLMAKEFISIPEDATIKEVTEYIRRHPAVKKGKTSYIYAVDKNRRLAGVIQVRDLLFYPPEQKVSGLIKSPVVQVETGMSPSDVAQLLKKHRFLGLPVVDAGQKLVGVINADNILQVMENETSDDIAKIVGISSQEIRTRSVPKIIRLRMPWLFFSIASGLICAVILGMFHEKVENIAVLFLFIPIVLGLSESIGVQGATIVVRNISLGYTEKKEMGFLLLREFAVGVLISIVCGVIVGFVASFWKASPGLGYALACSMVYAMFISSLIGLALPIIFARMKIDPSMASGPIVLAVCDIQTLIVYFSIATAMLG